MCRALLHAALQLRRHARHNQLLLRARHGNVKHPQLLRQIFQLHALPDDLPRQCRLTDAVLRIDRIRADAHPGMEYKRRTAVHLVKRFAHAREEYNREFQSFTLVNTHDTHRVCALPVNIHLAEIDFILLKLLDITDKVEQSTVTRRLKFHRLFHQHLQICPPLHTTRHCRCIAAVARLLENLCDQLMDRRIRHAASQRFELCKEPPQLLPECFIIPHRRIFSTCLVNFHVFIHTTHRYKLRVCASADGGTQNGRKWNLLTWIITQMQIIQHRNNFLRGKVPCF